MDDKTLTKAFCNIKRMRTDAVELKNRINNSLGGEGAYLNLIGSESLNPELILQAQYNKANKTVNILEFDSTQLDMDVVIDFDDTTTFDLTIWNLKDENEIIVGDQLEIKLYWDGYTRAADTLTISGFVTSIARTNDGADMKYTFKGDITADWALTYLNILITPVHIRTTNNLVSAIQHAGIRMVKTPDGTLPKQFLIKERTSIRNVLNMALTGFGADYTWTLLNDVIVFHKNTEFLKQSLDVIDLNNSDVIEYEIVDDRMHLKTFGLPELDAGSVFRYLEKAYIVSTIKHTFTHNGGYLCDIYSGEDSNANEEQTFLDE